MSRRRDGVEAVLANEHRKGREQIKKEFAEEGLTNLHVQFMKVGKQPTNIGLGPSVTAERARAAIRMAKKYNGNVTILLPERPFLDHYVAIASSSFDDTVEYPVSAEQLRELEIRRSQRSNFTRCTAGSRQPINRR
jgi:hypothetical protein